MQRRQLMKMAKSFDGKSTKSHFRPARHDGLSYIESIEQPAVIGQAEAEAGRMKGSTKLKPGAHSSRFWRLQKMIKKVFLEPTVVVR
jgi:hypothetical protein